MAAQFASSQFLTSSELGTSWSSFLNSKPSATKMVLKSDEFINLNSVDPFYADQRNPWRPALSVETADKSARKIQRPISPSEFIEINPSNNIWTSPSISPSKAPTLTKKIPVESATLSAFPAPAEPPTASTMPAHPDSSPLPPVQNPSPAADSTADSVFKFSGSNISLNIEEELTGQSLYKTELCRSFEETGNCRYGAKCQFAHGKAELRGLLRHPKYKTEVCKTFHTIGTCPYGNRCRFIHTSPENPRKVIQTFGPSQDFSSCFHQQVGQTPQTFNQSEQGEASQIPATAPPTVQALPAPRPMQQQQQETTPLQKGEQQGEAQNNLLVNSSNHQLPISQANLNKLLNTNTNDWSTSWKSNSSSSIPSSAVFKPTSTTPFMNNPKAATNHKATPIIKESSPTPSSKISTAPQKEKKGNDAPGLGAPSPKEVERRLAFFKHISSCAEDDF